MINFNIIDDVQPNIKLKYNFIYIYSYIGHGIITIKLWIIQI